MGVKVLRIQGFRSLRDVTWAPGALNVIIGPNGTGKSNLLRALELISASARGQLAMLVQEAGGMQSILWDGTANSISIELETLPFSESPYPDHEQRYRLVMGRLGQASSFRIDDELLADYTRVERGEIATPFKHLERHTTYARVFDEDEHGLVAPEQSVTDEETLLSQASGPFAPNRFIPIMHRELASWTVYHDVHVNRDAPIRQPVVAKSERRVAPNGQNLVSVLHTLYSENRQFKSSIDKAMRAAFGADFEELVFPPASDQRIQLRIRWASLQREQSAADLSDGTLRFLLLVAILASPDRAPLIAIDEPETGLHPSMLPIIGEYAFAASERSQVVFTTHSDSFLDAFGDVRPTTTVARWEAGETHLDNVSEEQLDHWLKEYSLGALFRSRELESIV